MIPRCEFCYFMEQKATIFLTTSQLWWFFYRQLFAVILNYYLWENGEFRPSVPFPFCIFLIFVLSFSRICTFRISLVSLLWLVLQLCFDLMPSCLLPHLELQEPKNCSTPSLSPYLSQGIVVLNMLHDDRMTIPWAQVKEIDGWITLHHLMNLRGLMKILKQERWSVKMAKFEGLLLWFLLLISP